MTINLPAIFLMVYVMEKTILSLLPTNGLTQTIVEDIWLGLLGGCALNVGDVWCGVEMDKVISV